MRWPSGVKAFEILNEGRNKEMSGARKRECRERELGLEGLDNYVTSENNTRVLTTLTRIARMARNTHRQTAEGDDGHRAGFYIELQRAFHPLNITISPVSDDDIGGVRHPCPGISSSVIYENAIQFFVSRTSRLDIFT